MFQKKKTKEEEEEIDRKYLDEILPQVKFFNT